MTSDENSDEQTTDAMAHFEAQRMVDEVKELLEAWEERIVHLVANTEDYITTWREAADYFRRVAASIDENLDTLEAKQ